jgi:hypothetical protein
MFNMQTLASTAVGHIVRVSGLTGHYTTFCATPYNRVLLEKLIVPQQVTDCPHFMELEGSLPLSQ